ncbi:TatD family hydrolase [Vibrio sp.]|nr:TatD family hydrolase [Vibrio sp.]
MSGSLKQGIKLFDTHCHFDFEPFRHGFNDHLLEAKSNHVDRFLIPSVGLGNWDRVQQLSSQYDDIYHALGIHPYFLSNAFSIGQQLQSLPLYIERRLPCCVAVGECGLDAFVDTPLNDQERVLLLQIHLAKNARLPLILHSRKADQRILALLKKEKFTYGGVLHGFSGSRQQADAFIQLGFYIGVGGVITYPRASKTRKAIEQLPIECLVLETDSPDMPINGYQGQINHPKYLKHILDALSMIKDRPSQEISEIVWNNSHIAFKISM